MPRSKPAPVPSDIAAAAAAVLAEPGAAAKAKAPRAEKAVSVVIAEALAAQPAGAEPPPAENAPAVEAQAEAPKAKAKPKAAKAVKPAKPAQAPAEPEEAPPRLKLVRDSFTMPRADFALIATLKERALGFQRPTKKSELLRAGLQALAALDDAQLQAVLSRLVPLKTGRPKKG